MEQAQGYYPFRSQSNAIRKDWRHEK